MLRRAIALPISSSSVRSTASRSLYTGIFNHHVTKQYNAVNTTTIPTPKHKHIPSNQIITRQYHSTPISSAAVSGAFTSPAQARIALITEIANFGDETLEPLSENAFNNIRKVLFDPKLNHVPSYIGGLCHEGMDFIKNTGAVNAQMEDGKEGMMRVLRAWHMPAMISVRSLKPPFKKEVGVISLEDYWKGSIAVLVRRGAMDMKAEAEVRRRFDGIKRHVVELTERMERLCERYERESKEIQKKYKLLEGEKERETFPLALVKKDWVKFYEDFARESEKQLADPKLVSTTPFHPLNLYHKVQRN